MYPPKASFAMLIAVAIFAVPACSTPEQPAETAPPPAQSTELTQIDQKTSGDYVVTLLSEGGSLSQGTNHLTLEFRRGGQLSDPGQVEVKPMMEMKGAGPMLANASTTQSATPGRYNVTTDLSMAGPWKFTINFQGGQAEFDLTTH